MNCARCSARPGATPQGLCDACATANASAAPRSPIGLSQAVVALLGVVILAELILIYASVNMRAQMGRVLALDLAPALWEDVERADQIMLGAGLFWTVAYIATAVVFICWFYRVRCNAEVFGPEHQERTAGWAIAAWFIPFANLVIPRGIALDIWDASEQKPSTSRLLLNSWWWIWVLSVVVDRIATNRYEDAENLEAIDGAAGLLIVNSVIGVVAAVLAIVFVRRLTAMQHAKALAGPNPATDTAPAPV
jgi:hypothetical protein